MPDLEYLAHMRPEEPVIADRRVYVTDYGADRRGREKCTEAFRRAVEDCASQGGGHVIVPRGVYLTGPIRLLDGIDLHLEDGAFILFSPDYDDYPLIMSHYEGQPSVRCTSPVWATDAENVSVTGSGTLDGNGANWWFVRAWEQPAPKWEYRLMWKGGWDNKNPARRMWWPSETAAKGLEYFREKRGMVTDLAEAEKYKPFFRPCLLEFKSCKKVAVSGITVQNSPAWSTHFFLCENVNAQNITVKNPWDAPNTDGLNIECSQKVRVTGCSFDVGDDAVCVKSGRNAPGRKIGVPTKDVYIASCRVHAAHGGFVVGSETACGIENVLVENCVFNRTDRGIRIKSAYGRGGKINNIIVRDITMHDIGIDAVCLTMTRDTTHMPAETPVDSDGGFIYSDADIPSFENITMQNVYCAGAHTALRVENLPRTELKNIAIKDSFFRAKQGIFSENADGFRVENCTFEDESGNEATKLFDSMDLGKDRFGYLIR